VWCRVLCGKWNFIILCHNLQWMWMYHRYNHASTQPRQLHFLTQNDECLKHCCTHFVSLATKWSCIREKWASNPLLCHSHFFTSSVTVSPLTCSHGWHLWGLQGVGNPRVQDMGCMMGREEHFIQVLWWLHVFSKLCMLEHCHVERGFLQLFFWWSLTVLASCCKVLAVHVYR
jgi:hypothetical protein